MSYAIRPQSLPRPAVGLLGFIAGFVDICTYFGLFGIFVAQLTGSFALGGVHLVSGHQDLLTLAAIPAFFAAGAVATMVAVARAPVGHPLPWVLALECTLLTAMVIVALAASPLQHRDDAGVVSAALLGIAAMGVQSAAVRLLTRGVPSTNVMTLNTTQIAMDGATVVMAGLGCGEAEQTRAARERLSQHWPPMACFMLGVVLGAYAFKLAGMTALLVPLAAACALLGWTAARR